MEMLEFIQQTNEFSLCTRYYHSLKIYCWVLGVMASTGNQGGVLP